VLLRLVSDLETPSISLYRYLSLLSSKVRVESYENYDSVLQQHQAAVRTCKRYEINLAPSSHPPAIMWLLAWLARNYH